MKVADLVVYEKGERKVIGFATIDDFGNVIDSEVTDHAFIKTFLDKPKSVTFHVSIGADSNGDKEAEAGSS